MTLLFAMMANLIVLPALLLQFDSGKIDKDQPDLVDDYPEMIEGEVDEEGKPKKKKNTKKK